MITFRALRADEIEARVSTVKESGMSLLLYKDARCDMRILDETFGPENWQRDPYECKGNLFCRVGILTENGWVWKSDCGTESYAEKEKGESSDSFKRACFNWGIGRELYTAPFIWINPTGKDGKPNYRDKYDRFAITYLNVEDGRITALNIENPKLRRTVYMFGNCFPEYACCVCGKAVTKEIYEGSMQANGKAYCSMGCKRKDRHE